MAEITSEQLGSEHGAGKPTEEQVSFQAFFLLPSTMLDLSRQPTERTTVPAKSRNYCAWDKFSKSCPGEASPKVPSIGGWGDLTY